MDPAGIGGLLAGIAALLTAIKGLKKAEEAREETERLRAQLTQVAAVNQTPIVNVSPIFNVAIPAGAPRTQLTEGAAQLGATPIYEIEAPTVAPPRSTEGSQPRRTEPESES